MGWTKENGLNIMYDITNEVKYPFNDLERRAMIKVMRGIIYHHYIHFDLIVMNEDTKRTKLCNLSKLQKYTGMNNQSIWSGLYKLSCCVLWDSVTWDEDLNPILKMKPFIKKVRIISKKKITHKKIFIRFILNYNHKFYLNFLKPSVSQGSKLKPMYENKIDKFFENRGGFKKYREDLKNKKVLY